MKFGVCCHAVFSSQVLLQVQRELLDYGGTGVSVMEMSHRSPEFMKIVTDAQEEIQRLL